MKGLQLFCLVWYLEDTWHEPHGALQALQIKKKKLEIMNKVAYSPLSVCVKTILIMQSMKPRDITHYTILILSVSSYRLGFIHRIVAMSRHGSECYFCNLATLYFYLLL